MNPLLSMFDDENGWLIHNGKHTANFIPKVLGKYTSPDRAEMVIEVSFTISGKNESHLVLLSDLNDVRFDKLCSDCLCCDENGRPTHRLISLFLRLQLSEMPPGQKEGIYLNKTGWLNDTTFVAGSTILGVPLDVPYRFAPAVEALSPVCQLPDDPGPVVERVLRALCVSTPGYFPIFAFAIMAPLRSVFVKYGLPACGVLNLHGPQEVGKTHSAKTFFTPYSNSNGYPAFFVEANSTKRYVLSTIAKARDQVVVIDDIAKVSSTANGQERLTLASDILRMAFNNASRGKMSGKAQVEERCDACVVLTGELAPDTQSEMTRCITVEINKRSYGGPSREDVAAVTFSFIDWFGKNSGQEIARLKADYDYFMNARRSHEEERLQKSLWELRWAMSSFLRFARSVLAVNEKLAENICQQLTMALQKIYSETRRKLGRTVDTFTPLLSIICAGAAKKAFRHFYHKGCLCVTSEDLVRFLRSVPGLKNVSDSEIISLLRQNNLLRIDKSGRSTRKINGKRYLTIPI